jgi:hypothetical protein
MQGFGFDMSETLKQHKKKGQKAREQQQLLLILTTAKVDHKIHPTPKMERCPFLECECNNFMILAKSCFNQRNRPFWTA